MQCPECDVKMEREDGAALKGVCGDLNEAPNAIYYCLECGGEWIWILNEKLFQHGVSVTGADNFMRLMLETGNMDDKYRDGPSYPDEYLLEER